jgi:ABC-type polysaccharide/polyol phosphate export permease
VNLEKGSVYYYDAGKHLFKPLDEFRQIYRYRFLISQLLRRDIVTRYKRSVLGIAWTMLNPLGTMVVLTIAFSHIFNSAENYPAYVLSGLMGWNFFSQASTASMVNLVWGGGLLKRIYIPRTAFAISAIGTGIVNLVLTLIPLFVVMIFIEVPVRLTVLFLPVPVLFMSLFTLGVGLLISTFAVYFPDIAEMYKILLTAWMYLTPVIYPEHILSPTTQKIISTFNPMYGLIKLLRIPLYEGRMPTWGEVIFPGVISLVVFIVGWFVFVNRADEFAYKI